MNKLKIKTIANQLPTDEQLAILNGDMRKEHGLDTSREGIYNTLRFRGMSDFYAQVAVYYKAGKLSIKPNTIYRPA